jgi:hypothetical protein
VAVKDGGGAELGITAAGWGAGRAIAIAGVGAAAERAGEGAIMTAGVEAPVLVLTLGGTVVNPPPPPTPAAVAEGGQEKEKSSQATLVQIFAGPSEALERESMSMNSPCVP